MTEVKKSSDVREAPRGVRYPLARLSMLTAASTSKGTEATVSIPYRTKTRATLISSHQATFSEAHKYFSLKTRGPSSYGPPLA
jgi:hypothetical protein